MKNCLRVLAIVTMAGGGLSACMPGEVGVEGTGGSDGGVVQPGTGGSASGGATNTGGSASGGAIGTGGLGQPPGTGGSASGGATSTGGSASGGAIGTGGLGQPPGTGGRASGGVTGSGGQAGASSSGGRGGVTGSGGAPSGGGSSGTYNPCPTNGDPCRILPVGDSITFGINQEGSYRIELFHKATMAMQKITYTGTLQNGPQMVDGVTFPRRYEATSGITIDGISSQITRNNTLNMASDIILVHIGTNDMYMGDPGGAPARLGTLLDKLIAGMPNALIVVGKIIPLSSGSAAVKTFNNALPALVQTRAAAGKHIIIVDLFTGFPSSGMSSDMVHPNTSGYAWMGDVWYTAIGSLFPK